MFIKVWGCEAYVKWRLEDKLRPRSVKTYFVGYPQGMYGHYFYSPEEQRIFVAASATFLEKDFLSKPKESRTFDLSEVQMPESETELEETILPNSNSDIPEEPRRSSRTSHPPDRYIGMVEGKDEELVLLLESDEPTTYKGGLTGSNSKEWLGAMKSEMDSMYENQVWDLVDLPDNVRPLQCKWIFKIKRTLDGRP